MNNIYNFFSLLIVLSWRSLLASSTFSSAPHKHFSLKEGSKINTPNKSQNDTTLSAPSQENNPECGKFKTIAENWYEHKHKIHRDRWSLNGKVEIYQELRNANTNNKTGVWLQLYTSKVWEYMKKTYGELGPNPCLFVMVHHYNKNYTGGTRVYSLNSTSIPNQLNILDLHAPKVNSWKFNSPQSEDIDLLTNQLAYFVEFSSKGKLGSPSHNIWKQSQQSLEEHTAWADIFTYDVYLKFNRTKDVQRYRNKAIITKSDYKDFPKNEIFWFRDWFLPIYENYGGSTVLNSYFQVLHDELPPKFESINMGTFIHFWSTAARTDLTFLAEKAFRWNDTFQMDCVPECVYNATEITTRERDGNLIQPSSTNDSNNQVTTVAIASAAAMGVIILISVLCILFYKKKIRTLKTEIRSLTTEEVDEFFQGDPNAQVHTDENQALIQAMPFIKDYKIPKDQIILAHDKVIGTGQFGYVLHGFIRFSDRSENELVKVAVKMVRPNIDVVYFKAFLSEVKIMAYLGKHENIVDLLGTCTANIKDREISIALELCHFGSLLDYLKDNRHLFEDSDRSNSRKSYGVSQSIHSLQLHSGILNNFNLNPDEVSNKITRTDLLKWSHNVANAMVYLQQKKVIHGDLACRNVLLTAKRTAKICDFGLSRQVLNYASYMKTSSTPVPWRWLAIECMKEQKFSSASDVWAYGVLMWEIFSLGETPYGLYTYDLFFVDKLISGERLLKPTHADANIYGLMNDCWKSKPEERKTFQQILYDLDAALTKPVEVKKREVPTTEIMPCSPSIVKITIESESL